MKHTTEDLLLAAQIRNLVAGRMPDPPADLPADQRAAWQQQAVAQLTTAALKELALIADLITLQRAGPLR